MWLLFAVTTETAGNSLKRGCDCVLSPLIVVCCRSFWVSLFQTLRLLTNTLSGRASFWPRARRIDGGGRCRRTRHGRTCERWRRTAGWPRGEVGEAAAACWGRHRQDLGRRDGAASDNDSTRHVKAGYSRSRPRTTMRAWYDCHVNCSVREPHRAVTIRQAVRHTR